MLPSAIWHFMKDFSKSQLMTFLIFARWKAYFALRSNINYQKNTNNFLVNFLTNFLAPNYWIFAGCFFTPLTPKNESIFVPFPTKTSRKSNRVISKAEKMLWSAGGVPGRQKNGKNWAARTVMRKTRTLACAFVLLALSSSVCSWVRTLNPWRPRYHAFFDRLKRKCVE